MKSKIICNKKIYKNFNNTRYYEANEFLSKNLHSSQEDKLKFQAYKKGRIKDRIKEEEKETRLFSILEKIHEKNQDYAFETTKVQPINSDLLTIVTNPVLLFILYNKVCKKKRLITKLCEMSTRKQSTLNTESRIWYSKTQNSLQELVKKDKYLWGFTKKINFDRVEKITRKKIPISSLIGKVLHESIVTVLSSIWEPYFEKLNCSFGFRSNKTVNDAIIQLTGEKSKGLYMAIQGKIKISYDKLYKKRIIEILKEKINDIKFIRLIEKKLEYEFCDSQLRESLKEKNGLLQSGIDSSYIWNIYLLEFDKYISDYLKKSFDNINLKLRDGKTNIDIFEISKKRTKKRIRSTIIQILYWISKNKDIDTVFELRKINAKPVYLIKQEKIMSGGELYGFKYVLKKVNLNTQNNIKSIVKDLFAMSKKLSHQIYKLPTINPVKLKLRFIYVRYIDDFIILTNANNNIMEKIRKKISNFLSENLKTILLLEKTLITDIRKEPVRFLGYEIRTYKDRKGITPNFKVFAKVDKLRILNRLHMKGYCDKKGFPREIGFLSFLEDFSIIKRFNSVLIGICNYYVEFVRNPKTDLARWFYIVRFSCLKTLAQKHKSNIKGIFRNYKLNEGQRKEFYKKGIKTKTIVVKEKNIVNGKIYERYWLLKTPEELIRYSLALKKAKLSNFFND